MAMQVLAGASFRNVAEWRSLIPKPGDQLGAIMAYTDMNVYMMRVLSSLFMACITLYVARTAYTAWTLPPASEEAQNPLQPFP